MRGCWTPGFASGLFPRIRPACKRAPYLYSAISSKRAPYLYSAISLVMAQDPEREEEQQGQDELLTSHALDMVTLWSSGTVTAEMEADMIRGVLESNDIPVMVVGASQYPNLGFEVK